MKETVYGPIITLVATAVFGWLLIRGFVSGSMIVYSRGITFSGRRKDQPVRFWAVAFVPAFLTIGSALATIGQVFFPHGIGG